VPEEGRRIEYLKRSSINVPNDDRSGQHEPAIREELILATVQCCLRTLVDGGVVREDHLQRRYGIDWSSSGRLGMWGSGAFGHWGLDRWFEGDRELSSSSGFSWERQFPSKQRRSHLPRRPCPWYDASEALGWVCP